MSKLLLAVGLTLYLGSALLLCLALRIEVLGILALVLTNTLPIVICLVLWYDLLLSVLQRSTATKKETPLERSIYN